MCCIDVFSLPFAKKIGNKVYLFAVFFSKYLVKMRKLCEENINVFHKTPFYGFWVSFMRRFHAKKRSKSIF